MSRGPQPVRYAPAPQQQDRRAGPPCLYLVPSQSSQGVGVEAAEVALLMERLTTSINTTETLTRSLLSRLEEEAAPVAYDHVEAKHLGTLKVRYRNVGRLLPREVPVDDE